MNVSRPLLSLAISSAVLLSGCAGEYSFNTNLDSEAIDEYFKPANVALFKDNDRPQSAFNILGLVEGHSCQETENGVPATIADARTDARKKAAELGANGLIVKKCMLTEQKVDNCFSEAFCVGQAITIDAPQ
ncbi:Rcs stress response system protein RcsF [Shewanella donghaensis]|uniref:Rcs stress response system protein RcsF n=1 Tax=Shewanella donghaensis TaxID=238836 RepID=UPI0011826653|nr:Rcs stress response system protein RcsF [Shewanella donghaensis]